MKAIHEPTAEALTRGLRFIPAGWNTFAGLVIVVLVHAVLRFTSEELRLVAWSALPAGIAGLTIFTFYRERNLRTLRDFVRRATGGDATPELYERAFGVIVNLPRQEVILGQSVWCGLAIPILTLLYLGTDTFSGSSALIVGLTAIGLGAYVHIFVFFTLKRFLEPYRTLAASGIPDPDRRELHVKTLSVNMKLALAVASLIAGTTFFSVTTGQARLLRALEAVSTSAQRELLAQVDTELSRASVASELDLAPRAIPAKLGDAGFLVLDRESGEVLRGDESSLVPGEIRAILDSGWESGDSLAFNTNHSFAWAPHPDGRHLIVSVSTEEVMGVGMGHEGLFIILISLAVIIIALAAARIISQDVVRSLDWMRERVQGIAEGDLRIGDAFESEDDVGDLARGIERMSSALRSAIGEVMSSADRVEDAAGDISSASSAVAGTVDELNCSIRDATNGMEAVSVQAEGIRSSSLEFDQSVQHSSESVAQLSEAGHHLDESSELLAANIEQVTQSYEAMFHRIEEVGVSTSVLAQAADGTTGAMEEIATALREVDSNAAQTSSLSDTVKESAEQGRTTVLETIAGIESIQSETELVAALVGDLCDRTEEIGDIVSVIKNVADETGLLALNAAIIAAQAGDQGRSFAVVAGEIKGLAQRVFINAKEITERIAAVQEGAAKAVTAMERSTESVNVGVELAGAAGASLETITSAANESRERMLQVVRAVRDQSGAATQIVGLMSEVRGGVEAIQEIGRHQTVATEEVLQSTRSMSGAAELVQSATKEQGHGSTGIAQDIDTVRQVSARITRALDEQSTALAGALDLLAQVHRDTASNGESNRRTGASAQTLIQEAARLREGVRRFKV